MKKRIRTVVGCLLCLCAIIYGLVGKPHKKSVGQVEGYKYILELWHIDSFEGGIGSRRDFLLKSSLTFERQNKIIVSVISHSLQSAQVALQTSLPDMISCGNGLEVAQYLLPLSNPTNYSVCSYKNKSLAVPWARGVYALIGKGERETLIVSQSEFTQPLLALEKSGIKFKNIEVLSPSKAYTQYLQKGGYLLGTQRDIYRLSGRGIDVEYQPISGFSDLFQVICITTKDKQKIPYCEQFVSYLVSSEVQKKLTSIGMLSTTGVKLYKGEVIEKLEEVEVVDFVSFLTTPKNLKQMQKDSLIKLQG